MYKWLKRASQADKQEMVEIIAAHNELAHESLDMTGLIGTYSLYRSDAWGVKVVYKDESGNVDGQDSGSFVKCDNCKSVTDLWDGQIEFCPTCEEDWS